MKTIALRLWKTYLNTLLTLRVGKEERRSLAPISWPYICDWVFVRPVPALHLIVSFKTDAVPVLVLSIPPQD